MLSIEPPDLPGAFPRVLTKSKRLGVLRVSPIELLDLVLHLSLAVHLAVLPVASVDLAVGEPADAITMFFAVLKFARVDPSVTIVN